MNDITTVPSNKKRGNLLDPNILILGLLALPLLRQTFSKEKAAGLSTPAFNPLNLLDDLDIHSLNEKVTIVKKVGPFLPEPMIETLNTVMPLYDRVSSILGLIELLRTNKPFKPIVAASDLNQNQKMTQVFNVLKDDLPSSQIGQIKPLIDIVTNMDKYKALINVFTQMGQAGQPEQSGQPEQQAPNLEGLLGLFSSFMGDENNENADKMKDMLKMVELMSLLNTSDEDSGEDSDDGPKDFTQDDDEE